jgi:hypothetical protein
MHNLAKGIRVERTLKQQLETEGYAVTRAAASKGAYDLIALNRRQVRLISVKSGRKFPALVRRAVRGLRQAPAPATVTKELWWWEGRKGWTQEIICGGA